MMLRVPDDYDANWCPDCGEPRGVCRCDELQFEITENLDDDFCETCWNSGFVSVCCDDLCQGEDGCIHGDGNVPCPECNGRSAW